VEAHKRLLTFIEEQSAAEQASSLAAAKLSSVQNTKCNWLTVGACLFDSALNGPSLILCQVSGCSVLNHHACQAEWENGDPAGKLEDAINFALVAILQPNFWLFLKDLWLGQLVHQ
jgi:hypothetical protein